ncbi:MAG: glycosyltransferase family 4 protein [Flavobacteriaceae bacterium]|nr:glycosyltransferase family 4 protein [Flavobacteriaceae bacterium]
MKVLIITDRLGIGGIQTFVYELVKGLKKKNIEIKVYCIYPELNSIPAVYSSYINQNEIISYSSSPILIKIVNKITTLIRKNNISKKNNFRWYTIKKHFNKYIYNNSFDIVHSNSILGDTLLQNLYYKGSRIYFVNTFHGQYKLDKDKHKKLLDFVLLNSKGVVLLSDTTLNTLAKIIPQQKIIRINNALSRRLYSFKNSPNPVFHMTARLNMDKGWKELAYSFYKLYKINLFPQKCELQINCSDESVMSVFDKKIRPFIKLNSKELPEKITFGLLPSYHEEMPFSIIEYINSRIPVLTTPVGALTKMLGKNNTFIKMKDNKVDKSNLLENLIQLINVSEKDRLKMSNKVYENSSKFDYNKFIDSYYKMYYSAIDN